MELYPIMINLEGRRVCVIGAGEVALRKVKDLLGCGALVSVIAPLMHEGFAGLAEYYGDRLVMIKREYRYGDVGDSVLVFSATNDERVNGTVFNEAQERNILINAVDDPPNCSFFIPSSYRKGDLIMTLSTSGASPAMAARIRRELQKHIPEHIDIMLEALKEAREMLKSDSRFVHLDSVRRGEVLKTMVNDDARLEELRLSFEQGSLGTFLLQIL
ncbi:MAG: siroheme synthase [Spirochaetae bacterium HGW-Spirochaetae-1]|jgi:precorrin-2 dehydrogenase/sirohydrochlorin ferrochelatase|nr:MAG: siroheme synthase [Spirochaetae bacterium HGW-Spirochaetae-1]